MADTTLPHHGDLPANTTWNAPSVFSSDDAWENEWNLISAGLSAHAEKYQGHLADSAALLYEVLADAR